MRVKKIAALVGRDIAKHLLSRGSVAFLSTLLCAAIGLTSTYAWVTASDLRINQYQGNARLNVLLNEKFVPVLNWEPGAAIPKEVKAHNTGNVDALVRVTFEEVLRKQGGVPVVQTQPGPYTGADVMEAEHCDIGAYSAASGWVGADSKYANIDYGTLSSAVAAKLTVRCKEYSSATGNKTRYAIYYDLGEGLYQCVTAAFAVSGTVLQVRNIEFWAYEYPASQTDKAAWGQVIDSGAASATPPPDIGKGHTITCDGNILFDYGVGDALLAASPADAGKWYYYKGYFYWLGKLTNGQETGALMNGLRLAVQTAAYSGAKFHFILQSQAIQNEESAISGVWNLSATADAGLYHALKAYCAA